jgi:sec-independent protein translocase protein TatA
MDTIGAPELLIILVIVILVFGVGRLGKIGAELGAGIRSFREGLKDPEEAKKDAPDQKAVKSFIDQKVDEKTAEKVSPTVDVESKEKLAQP